MAAIMAIIRIMISEREVGSPPTPLPATKCHAAKSRLQDTGLKLLPPNCAHSKPPLGTLHKIFLQVTTFRLTEIMKLLLYFSLYFMLMHFHTNDVPHTFFNNHQHFLFLFKLSHFFHS